MTKNVYNSFRSIDVRNQREKEQNKVLDLLTERLNWHGQTANSMFVKHKFLQILNYDAVCLLRLFRCFSKTWHSEPQKFGRI